MQVTNNTNLTQNTIILIDERPFEMDNRWPFCSKFNVLNNHTSRVLLCSLDVLRIEISYYFKVCITLCNYFVGRGWIITLP